MSTKVKICPPYLKLSTFFTGYVYSNSGIRMEKQTLSEIDLMCNFLH